MKSKHLRTQVDILAAYGGKRGMADEFELSQQAICNWFGETGHGIPAGYHYRVHLWLASKGYVLHPEAFGLRQDGRPLPRVRARAA